MSRKSRPLRLSRRRSTKPQAASSSPNRKGEARYIILGVTFIVVIVGLATLAYLSPSNTSQVVVNDGETLGPSQDGKVSLPDGWVELGGVARPATDVRERTASSEQLIDNPPKKLQGYSPSVDPNKNANTRYVAAALKDRTNASAFSSFVPSAPFDREAFLKSPQEYLDRTEPGRVFAPAEPAEGVAAIRAEGGRYFDVVQGESVALSVAAEPNMPVAFLSESLGYFENGLTGQTVLANDQGIATAKFTAGGGTVDMLRILAASPVHSGQVAFTVNVQLPQRAN